MNVATKPGDIYKLGKVYLVYGSFGIELKLTQSNVQKIRDGVAFPIYDLDALGRKFQAKLIKDKVSLNPKNGEMIECNLVDFR